ncbi:MAG: hypothetical protein HY923_07865 [Elusimicrobia bacterium]|nr:hypothetical protein [Elusimicrobiota bacterium]
MRLAIGVVLCLYGAINALIAVEERAALPFAVVPLLLGAALIKSRNFWGNAAAQSPTAHLLECPHCKGLVEPKSKQCRHCKAQLKPVE